MGQEARVEVCGVRRHAADSTLVSLPALYAHPPSTYTWALYAHPPTYTWARPFLPPRLPSAQLSPRSPPL